MDDVDLDDVVFTSPFFIGTVDDVVTPTPVNYCTFSFKIEDFSTPVIDWYNMSVDYVIIYPPCYMVEIDNEIPLIYVYSCSVYSTLRISIILYYIGTM